MTGTVLVEIVGLKNAECCPFPCDENRSCGLSGCYPTGNLLAAFDELNNVLKNEYDDRVDSDLPLLIMVPRIIFKKLLKLIFPRSPSSL